MSTTQMSELYLGTYALSEPYPVEESGPYAIIRFMMMSVGV